MSYLGQTADHNPALGTDSAGRDHFEKFLSWAKLHKKSTIALQILGLLKVGLEEELLGGLLQFFSYRQSAQILQSWSLERPRLWPLANLSEHLGLHFPDLKRAKTSPAIGDQFSSQVTSNYLACQFSTRQAPRFPAAIQLRLTCFRVWIMFKALEYASNGNTFDLSLQNVCKYTRMALDTQGDSRKLDFLIGLLQSSSDLADFEQLLGEAVKLKRTEPQNSSSTEFLRAVQSLLNNQHKRLDDVTATAAFQVDEEIWKETSRFDDESSLQLNVDLSEDSEITALVSDDGTLIETTADENKTISEVIREGRGIAFLSREDLHYLPFSWNRLRSDEQLAFQSAVHRALLNSITSDQLIAGIGSIASACRHSMDTIRSMPISIETKEGWALNPETWELHRRASRRRTRWHARGDALTWVKSLGDVWTLQIHDPLKSVLKNALKEHPEAKALGDLWNATGKSLEAAFNEWCRIQPGLGRVTSGMLARTLEQHAYEFTHDHVFAQLISNPTGTGIPGSGAYPSWPLSLIAKTLSNANASMAPMASNIDINAIGSELDPDDSMLSAALHHAFAKVQELAGRCNSWIEHHNHLTAYSVAVLLAATGARPVDSVFESSKQFNLKTGLVYIEDKVVSMGEAERAGRLVPLPKAVIEFIKCQYLPYLLRLADGIRLHEPEFAREIEAQGRGEGSIRLPLFFFLRSVPDFQWYPVTESTFDALTIVDWPLPLNLFRHRLAVRLRSLNLDPELIDAQLGHAESGAETHGDMSFRCWMDDFPSCQSSIEEAFQLLSIQLPCIPDQVLAITDVKRVYELFPEQDLFGQRARAQKRKAHHESARKAAISEINAFVGKRKIESIEAKEWEKLGRQMILTDGNLRQANALIRAKAFESFLQRAWKDGSGRPRLRKWITALPMPRSAFFPGSVDITERLEKCRQALDSAFLSLKPPSKMSIADAAVLVTVDLALNGRIADLEVLSAISRPQEGHIQLVVSEKLLYLEHSIAMEDAENPALKRYLVPTRCAKYLEGVLSARKKIKWEQGLPDFVREVSLCIDQKSKSFENLDELLRQLANSVDMENSILLPGAVAGVLAGRVNSYALNHSDWLRVKTGKSYVISGPSSRSTGTDSPLELGPPLHRLHALKSSRGEDDNKIGINSSFIREIRKILNEYFMPALDSANAFNTAGIKKTKTPTNTETESRAATRSKIAALIKNADAVVSLANLALADWVIFLLKRPYRRKLLDGISVQRYLSALSAGFRSFGYDVDLADLDADELTEFYAQVIDPCIPTDENDDDEGKTEDATQPAKKKLSAQYTFARLRDFHLYSRSRYGLEEPDWSDLGEGLLGSIARPGFISKSEYLHALRGLCAEPSRQHIPQVRDAFILLLTFRFGLRGSEAISLPRNNWIDVARNVVVLVNGQFRKLKTKRSARQIPLLELLSDLETQVVMTWMDYWEAETSGNVDIPLFFADREKGGLIEIRYIRDRVIAALRKSTGAAHTNLHHARHSFGNRIGIPLLLGPNCNLWRGAQLNASELAMHFRSTLLTTTCTTRRAPWALARLLGHVNSSTTVNSYLHFLFDLTAQLVSNNCNRPLFMPLTGKLPISTLDLDTWSIRDDYLSLSPVVETSVRFDHSPAQIIEYCRLRAHGMTPTAAASHCLLQPFLGALIEKSLIFAGSSLSGQTTTSSQVSAQAFPLGFLGHIQNHRWRDLIEWAKTRQMLNTGGKHPENIGLQVGPTRQILLWKKEHFRAMQSFLNWCGWSNEDIQIYAPKNLSSVIKTWVSETSLGELRGTVVDRPSAGGNRKLGKKIKVFQVDTVRMRDSSDTTEVVYPDRVAVVRGSRQALVNDNYELILLWLAFSLGQPQQSLTN